MTAHAPAPAPTPAKTSAPISEIASFIHMTGPQSYDYIFGSQSKLEKFIAKAWPMTGTLYSYDATTLVEENNTIIGIELGYPGKEFYSRRHASLQASINAAEDGSLTTDDLYGIGERADKASYLNAWVPEDVYYLMALAVPDTQRGRGIGKHLLASAIDKARADGFRALHLDVLSDNPAIGLYTAMGLTCLAETIAPEPCRDHGIPMEMRMGITL